MSFLSMGYSFKPFLLYPCLVNVGVILVLWCRPIYIKGYCEKMKGIIDCMEYTV